MVTVTKIALIGLLAATNIAFAMPESEGSTIERNPIQAVSGKRYECFINGDQIDCFNAHVPTVPGNVYDCNLNGEGVPVCAKVES